MPKLFFQRQGVGELSFNIPEVQLAAPIVAGLEGVGQPRFRYQGMDLQPGPPGWQQRLKKPLFFEWQKIECFFEADASSPFTAPYSLCINGLPLGIYSENEGKKVRLSTSFSLEGAVGYTDISLLDARGRQVFVLETEVFPQKLDYKEDFHFMQAEIASMVYNLAFDLLKKTYQPQMPAQTPRPLDAEWLAILSRLFEPMLQSLDRIRRQPWTSLKTQNRLRPVGEVRKAGGKLLRWIQKHPQYHSPHRHNHYPLGSGLHLTHLPDQQKLPCYDNLPNRFVYWAAKRVMQQLEHMQQQLRSLNRNALHIQQLSRQLRDFRRKLSLRLQDEMFQNLSAFNQPDTYSAVLSMAPGYREFYRRFLMLQKGLSLYEHGLFRMSYKDTATLYEYWCFFKLLSVLTGGQQVQLSTQSLIRIHHNRLQLRLQKGMRSAISLEHPNGNRMLLVYSPRFATDTFAQIPDILLEIYKPGFEHPFRILLDAKYRFDSKNDSAYPSAVPYGPPTDAIAQLHRYRDAILFSPRQRHEHGSTAAKAFGGIVLFPYPGKAADFIDHPFYKSIAEVNIGAIPLLPAPQGGHYLLRTYLHELLQASPHSLYEQVVEYEKTEHTRVLQELKQKVLIVPAYPQHRQSSLNAFFHQQAFPLPWQRSLAQQAREATGLALFDEQSSQLVGYAKIVGLDFALAGEGALPELTRAVAPGQHKFVLFSLEEVQPVRLFCRHTSMRPFFTTNVFALRKALASGEENDLKIQDYQQLKALG